MNSEPDVGVGSICFTFHLPEQSITMKEGIHPEYYETTVSCGCGNSFVTRSSLETLKIDICNACHPFFTGKMKNVDREGRIKRFENRFAKGSYASLQKKGKK